VPIKSYLIQAQSGKYRELVSELQELASCEVIPSTNKELIVLVTETESDHSDQQLLNTINSLENLKMMSLVSGFEIDN